VNKHQFDADFWVLKSLSNQQPVSYITVRQLQIPANVELADPYFYKPQRIDLLLGADSFFDLLCTGQIKLNDSGPLLQKTLVGWFVSGRCKGI
ncbi:hypothetical protein KR215_003384, partial [Drosophila sulfurigaster]